MHTGRVGGVVVVGVGAGGVVTGGAGGVVEGDGAPCTHCAYCVLYTAQDAPACSSQQAGSCTHATYMQCTASNIVHETGGVTGEVGTGTGAVGTGTGGLAPPENMTSITLKKLFDVSPTSHTLRMMWYPSSVGTLHVWSVVIGGIFMPPSTTQNGASSNVARVSGAFGFHPARVM